MVSTLAPVWNWTLDALFPPRCCGCARFCRARFCHRCAPQTLRLEPPFCLACGTPFDPLAFHDPLCQKCRTEARHLEFARSAWVYEGAPRAAIHRFKYHGKSALAARLAPVLAEVARSDGGLSSVRFDFVCPVPLHPRRQRRRGFNQSELLARALSRELEIPLARLLVRTRFTPPQVGLNTQERAQNVEGAFARSPRASMDAGARVLLVDDVHTTGATLRECARVLREAGAATVCSLTLARQVEAKLKPLLSPERLWDEWVF